MKKAWFNAKYMTSLVIFDEEFTEKDVIHK